MKPKDERAARPKRRWEWLWLALFAGWLFAAGAMHYRQFLAPLRRVLGWP